MIRPPPPAVWITGVGPVTALGIGREPFTAALANAQSGIAPLTRCDGTPLGVTLAAQVPAFNLESFAPAPKGYLDPGTAYALAALQLAIRDANLTPNQLHAAHAGLVLGTAWGNPETLALFYEAMRTKGPRLAPPLLFPHAYANSTISLLAIEHALDGYHACFTSGATAAANALVAAFDRIRAGADQLLFVGGHEVLGRETLAAAALRGQLSPAAAAGPERCAPFDRTRNGTVLGEAAVILVLENADHARARGARPLAVLAGAGMTAGNALAQPGPTGATPILSAMRLAAPDAPPDCILAAANGSPPLDAHEARAIRAAFPPPGAPFAVTALAPLTGETLGANAAVQAAAACALFHANRIPHVLNLAQPDESAAELPLVTGAPLPRIPTRILANAVDPGGACVSLLFTRPEPTP